MGWTSPTTGYDNFVVTGSVTLGSAALTISGSYVPAIGDVFTIVSGGSVSNTFFGKSNARIEEGHDKTHAARGIIFWAQSSISVFSALSANVVSCARLSDIHFRASRDDYNLANNGPRKS